MLDFSVFVINFKLYKYTAALNPELNCCALIAC